MAPSAAPGADLSRGDGGIVRVRSDEQAVRAESERCAATFKEDDRMGTSAMISRRGHRGSVGMSGREC